MNESKVNTQSGHLDTYLDHFLLCARNPTLPKDQTAMVQGCMSQGGIPVQPYFALGGFKEDNYQGTVLNRNLFGGFLHLNLKQENATRA